jgi:hypothetical protein
MENFISTLLNLACIQQKAVRLYQTVKEESAILSKGAVFQDVTEMT